MKQWLAAVSMLLGLALALGSLFALMTYWGPRVVLLVAHLTAYGLILSGFDQLLRTRHE